MPAYYNDYASQLRKLGVNHLPGVRWAWDDQMNRVLPNPSDLDKIKKALAVRGEGKKAGK